MAGSGPGWGLIPLPAGRMRRAEHPRRIRRRTPPPQEPRRPLRQPDSDALVIAEQGIFSAGGTVIESDGTFDVSNYYTSREGSTAHVDHANVLYQIPENDTGLPMVFLHGYGQSRMGWMTTPDGREGWCDMFLRMGHSVWLIDQPRRGEAGQTSVAGTMTTTPSDQTWYTQFRIGTYLNDEFTYNEGSQFPQGEDVLDQFFRQMTPDTGMDNADGRPEHRQHRGGPGGGGRHRRDL